MTVKRGEETNGKGGKKETSGLWNKKKLDN